jgi:hypothetical protein
MHQNRITRRLSYANVIASLALFISLGGEAYAAVAIPANSVGTNQLKERGRRLEDQEERDQLGQGQGPLASARGLRKRHAAPRSRGAAGPPRAKG